MSVGGPENSEISFKYDFLEPFLEIKYGAGRDVSAFQRGTCKECLLVYVNCLTNSPW